MGAVTAPIIAATSIPDLSVVSAKPAAHAKAAHVIQRVTNKTIRRMTDLLSIQFQKRSISTLPMIVKDVTINLMMRCDGYLPYLFVVFLDPHHV